MDSIFKSEAIVIPAEDFYVDEPQKDKMSCCFENPGSEKIAEAGRKIALKYTSYLINFGVPAG
jgi:hypothetical protein